MLDYSEPWLNKIPWFTSQISPVLSNEPVTALWLTWIGLISSLMLPAKCWLAVACDQSVQLKVAWCCRWNLGTFFKICSCFVLLYKKSLNDCSPGEQQILFPSNLKKQNSPFPSGPVIKCGWLRVGQFIVIFNLNCSANLIITSTHSIFFLPQNKWIIVKQFQLSIESNQKINLAESTFN